jgi:hypothetical protein
LTRGRRIPRCPIALISRSDFDLLMDRADEANRGTTGRIAGNGVINTTSAQLFVLAINTLPSAFKARAVLDRVVD